MLNHQWPVKKVARAAIPEQNPVVNLEGGWSSPSFRLLGFGNFQVRPQFGNSQFPRVR
jgi:hypothetical protein